MTILAFCLAATLAQEGEVDRMWTQFMELKRTSYTRSARIRLYNDTLADFQRFLAAHPTHADAHTAEWRIIQILILGHNDEKATKRMEAFRTRYPDSEHIPGIRMETANLLLRGNDEKGALSALEEFLKHHPDDPRAFGARMKLGIVQRNLARFAEAEETFRSVRKDFADRPESWGAELQLAVTLQAAERTGEACRTLEGTLRDTKDDAARQTAAYYLSQYHRIARGTTIPDFKGTDAFGTSVSRKEFEKRVGVVYFFDPTRNLAAEEAEFIGKIASTFKDRDLKILGVCVAPAQQRFHNFREAHRPTWTMYYEGEKLEGAISRGFGVTGLPALYVTDREGNIRHFNLSGRDLENALEKLLKEK